MSSEPKPGTVDERPRWEGPPENRPRGYKPAKDDPEPIGTRLEKTFVIRRSETSATLERPDQAIGAAEAPRR
jgi:hypothetical protein